MPDLSIAAATALTFMLAGFVKGVIGLGLPTVSVGLLSLLMPPAQAAAILVIPSVLTNLWQMFGPRFWPLMRRFGPCCSASVSAPGQAPACSPAAMRAALPERSASR